MSTGNQAVFLSYASQDAEAARKICDALRSGGVEVWFDADGGLEHGDEWDAKIRRQIKECVLFIPVISANTQAREEGYFRLEWDLAAERARTIASGVPFILPVVIDDTREPDALVPDRFRTVQWTRLRDGEVPRDVLARLLKLWSHRTGVLKNEAPHASATPVAAPPSAAEAIGKPGAKNYAFIAVAVAVIVVGAGWWLLGGRNKPAASLPMSAAVATAPAPKVPSAAPLSEARQLANKARALFDALDGTRDDFKLAEELIAKAKSMDATDAEVCAAEAQLHERFIHRGWDASDARRESARAAVQRAVRLDPQSFEVRWAQAALLSYTGREGEERTRQLRELRRERPKDQRILRALGTGLGYLDQLEEGGAILDESAALPGGDPLALYNKSQANWFAGHTAEAESAIEASIAQKPFTGALLMSVWYKTILHGDLDGARALLNRISPADLIEDRASFFAYNVEWLARRPDAAIARLAVVPRDWLDDSWFHGPKGQLVGDALQLAGRPDAAAAEWRGALMLLERRLAADASSRQLLLPRLMLLAKLGRREEAERQFALLTQLSGTDLARPETAPPWIGECCVLLGRKADAIRIISAGLKRGTHAVDFTAADLRLNPEWDPLRGEPEFAAIIAEAERIEKAAAFPGGGGGGGGTAMAPVRDDKSVAVLAFANLSDDKNNEYFSDGIADELLTTLQKIPGLKVAAHTSAWSFKGKNATAQEIGEKLGVAHVVEGSVQKSGHRVKITARLSRAATNEEVWSKSFGPLELTDVFATQSELAQAIVGELRGRLTGDTAGKAEIAAQVQAAEKGGTKNVEAHQLYLQGIFFAAQFSKENLARAERNFRRATELDASFALGWAALAREIMSQAGYGMNDRPLAVMFGEARRYAERALALEPDLAEGHAAIMRAQLWYDLDWRGAAAAAQRALALSPANPEILSSAAQVALAYGQADRGLELATRAVALDPLHAEVRTNLANILFYLGKFPAAEAEFRRLLELNPGSYMANGQLGLVLVAEGKPEAAAPFIARETDPDASCIGRAFLYWAQHRQPEADAALREVTARADIISYQAAEIYTYRGETEAAFAWLDRAFENHDSGLAFARVDQLLAPLHADPRWPVFLKKAGLSDEQLK